MYQIIDLDNYSCKTIRLFSKYLHVLKHKFQYDCRAILRVI